MLCQLLLYSGVTQSGIYVHSVSHIILHHGPSQETGYRSLRCTAGPHCLAILNVVVCIYQPQTPRPSHSLPLPLGNHKSVLCLHCICVVWDSLNGPTLETEAWLKSCLFHPTPSCSQKFTKITLKRKETCMSSGPHLLPATDFQEMSGHLSDPRFWWQCLPLLLGGGCILRARRTFLEKVSSAASYVPHLTTQLS